MYITFTGFCIFLFFLISSCSSPKYLIPDNIPSDPRNTVPVTLCNKLQNSINLAVNKYNLPAVQVAVILKDGRRWTGIAGTTDYSRKKLAINSSLFRIASTTKLYTAVVIMKLYERRLIDLNTTIDKWFPRVVNLKTITIRMLLNHTSGLPDTFENFGSLLISGIKHSKIWTDMELIERHNGKPYFDPGKDWKYSNANYIILGLLIEKITQKTLEQTFDEFIFKPLSLTETYYRPYIKPHENLLSGFDRDLMPYPNSHDPKRTSWSSLAAGSGALFSSQV